MWPKIFPKNKVATAGKPGTTKDNNGSEPPKLMPRKSSIRLNSEKGDIRIESLTKIDKELKKAPEDILTYTIDSQENSQVSSIKDIEYQNITSDSETHGRENLKIELLENEMISIKGRIQIFPDEYIDLDILEEIKKKEVTIPFSKSDELVISWQ